MLFERGNRRIRVTDEVQARPFLNSGWRETEETLSESDNETTSSVKSPLEELTIEQLRAYAADRGINIPGQVTRRETILNRIREAQNEAE